MSVHIQYENDVDETFYVMRDVTALTGRYKYRALRCGGGWEDQFNIDDYVFLSRGDARCTSRGLFDKRNREMHS